MSCDVFVVHAPILVGINMDRELRLHSPVGAEPVVYSWPLTSGRGSVSNFTRTRPIYSSPKYRLRGVALNPISVTTCFENYANNLVIISTCIFHRFS